MLGAKLERDAKTGAYRIAHILKARTGTAGCARP